MSSISSSLRLTKSSRSNSLARRWVLRSWRSASSRIVLILLNNETAFGMPRPIFVVVTELRISQELRWVAMIFKRKDITLFSFFSLWQSHHPRCRPVLWGSSTAFWSTVARGLDHPWVHFHLPIERRRRATERSYVSWRNLKLTSWLGGELRIGMVRCLVLFIGLEIIELFFQVMRSCFARESPGPYSHFAVPRMIGLWVYVFIFRSLNSRVPVPGHDSNANRSWTDSSPRLCLRANTVLKTSKRILHEVYRYTKRNARSTIVKLKISSMPGGPSDLVRRSRDPPSTLENFNSTIMIPSSLLKIGYVSQHLLHSTN